MQPPPSPQNPEKLEMPDSHGRLRTAIAAAALVLAGGALGACGESGPKYAQFANGFDFAVTAKITDADGETQTLTVPSKGRVGADLEGSYTIEFLTPDGTSMKKKKFKFASGDKRKKGCQEYVNVLGSAAIVEEDIVYGAGIKGGGKLLCGYDHVKVCPRWGFETEKPPEKITVKEGTVGMNRTWLHYIGEGDWVASIDKLLAQKPQMGDQDRIRAWNIAFAVNKFDPDNPRLKAQGPKFVEACHKIVDMFKSGPLAGKAKKDCLKNAKAMFPDA